MPEINLDFGHFFSRFVICDAINYEKETDLSTSGVRSTVNRPFEIYKDKMKNETTVKNTNKNPKCDLNTLVVDLFDFQGKAIGKSERKELKIKLAPYFVLLENDLLSAFGTTKITAKEIESPKFRERYVYLSQNYSTEQITELYRLLIVCRNTMCHLLFRAKENEEMYRLSEWEMLDGLRFFDGIPCHVDGYLTLQGMLCLMVLFMNNEQITKLIDTVPTLPGLCCGKHFYRSDKELGLKSTENSIRIKNELKRRFKDFNVFSFKKNADIPLGFFNYKFISTLVCDAVFTVENYFYNLTDNRLCRRNSNFNDAFAGVATSETADAWIKVRNSWAHGDFLGIRNESGKHLLTLLIDALELLCRDMDAYNGNGCGKARRFAKKISCEIAERILSYKYHRAVELAIKISLPEKYDTADKVTKMGRYIVDETLILPEDEKRLCEVAELKTVGFSFTYKIKEMPELHPQFIQLYNYSLSEGMYAVVQGVRLNSTAITVANVDGCVFPTVEIYSADDTPILGLAPVLRQDLTFFKSYVCEVKSYV